MEAEEFSPRRVGRVRIVFKTVFWARPELVRADGCTRCRVRAELSRVFVLVVALKIHRFHLVPQTIGRVLDPFVTFGWKLLGCARVSADAENECEAHWVDVFKISIGKGFAGAA